MRAFQATGFLKPYSTSPSKRQQASASKGNSIHLFMKKQTSPAITSYRISPSVFMILGADCLDKALLIPSNRAITITVRTFAKEKK